MIILVLVGLGVVGGLAYWRFRADAEDATGAGKPMRAAVEKKDMSAPTPAPQQESGVKASVPEREPAEPAEPEQETEKGLKYSTTWYGNSFPGGPRWVQSHISYLSALPDGRLITSSPWDEAHREDTVYSADGDLLGGVPNQRSRVIGGDNRYIYVAYRSDNDVKVDGSRWKTLARYHADDIQRRRAHKWYSYKEGFLRPAPFEGGRGDKGHLLAVASREERVRHDEDDGWRAPQQFRGIASNDQMLVVSEDVTHKVHVYDVDSMQRTHQFDLKYPGPLDLDAEGNIWIIHRPKVSEGRDENAQEKGDYRIVQYTPEGEPTGREITDVIIPTDLAIGGPEGRMHVADIGPGRINVQIFDISQEKPQRVGQLGEPDGVYGGPVPGRMGTHRFDFLSGVGVDDEGYISISTRGRAGSFVRRFTPDGKEMLWQIYSAQFMNPTAFDDAYDGTVTFGCHGGINRFVLDYSREGRLDDWVAITSDPRRFPHDYRWHRVHARHLDNDETYLIVDAKRLGTLILRQEDNSEIFMPSVFLSAMGKGYPPHRPMAPKKPQHPRSRRVMWRDLDGNGQFDKDEYVVNTWSMDETSWQMDSEGALWEWRSKGVGMPGKRSGFLRHSLQGFDKHNNPVYEFQLREADYFPHPSPFPSDGRQSDVNEPTVQRYYYDAKHDRMFISGYAEDYDGPKGGSGANFARYDNFTDPDRRELVSRIDFPTRQDKKKQWYHIQSWAVAGDLLFAGLGKQIKKQEFVHVYNTRTGEHLGAMYTGEELYHESSWLDITHALNAFIRENGEIIVTVENNWKNLQIVFRIPPDQSILEGLELPASGWDEKKPTPVEAIDPGFLQ